MLCLIAQNIAYLKPIALRIKTKETRFFARFCGLQRSIASLRHNRLGGCYTVKQRFINKISAIFDKYNIDRTRLILFNTLANREDVKAVLQLADVYLDSYPYAGANSTVYPLEVGLPTVVRDGNNLRSRQGAAILRDIQLFDLIADSEESYIKLSVALGTNTELRKQNREEIEPKMQQQPRFLDSRAYSAALGSVFEKMLIVNRL
ncbi:MULTISPECIES: O-linked N-acetylglucosamine transferase family protein [unclassified Microcoleus]|uniref:O-linked N-acetylglucosamine transferase family protein n=1 Tax=unclassified Microcoleus TaxID=2642155 RepID=UPI002FD685A7